MFRYCDDILILHNDKIYLYNLLNEIKEYLNNNLKLEVKDNYQIFPVDKRYIDIGGYKFKFNHSLLRKSIKKRMIKTLKYNRNYKSIGAYNGWLKWCDSKHLRKKLFLN